MPIPKKLRYVEDAYDFAIYDRETGKMLLHGFHGEPKMKLLTQLGFDVDRRSMGLHEIPETMPE